MFARLAPQVDIIRYVSLAPSPLRFVLRHTRHDIEPRPYLSTLHPPAVFTLSAPH